MCQNCSTRGQEMGEIQQSITTSQSGLGSTIISVSTKFEINSLRGLSGNVKKPQKSDGWTNRQRSQFLQSPSNYVGGAKNELKQKGNQVSKKDLFSSVK